MSNKPELYFNGERVSEPELYSALDEVQEYMIDEEQKVAEKFGVSTSTASAIVYLRTRSRWTSEKEKELVDRDKAGNPFELGLVLSGVF
jgi:hypothetical protein